MKKILLSLSVVVFAAMMLVSCSKSSPKDVANTWLTGFYHMDYEAAKKVSTDDTKNFISQLSALSGMMPDSSKKQMQSIKVNIKDVKEEGDNATVTYTLSNEPKEQALKLVKQNGKWLVQFSKNDAGGEGGGADAGASDAGSPADTLGGSPAATDAPADTAKH